MNSNLLGCDAVFLDKFPTFRTSLLPSSLSVLVESTVIIRSVGSHTPKDTAPRSQRRRCGNLKPSTPVPTRCRHRGNWSKREQDGLNYGNASCAGLRAACIRLVGFLDYYNVYFEWRQSGTGLRKSGSLPPLHPYASLACKFAFLPLPLTPRSFSGGNTASFFTTEGSRVR